MPEVFYQDKIAPIRIEHKVDAGWTEPDRRLLFHHNFIVYDFSNVSGGIGARTYLDDISQVAIYFPKGWAAADSRLEPVLHYLKHRFRQVDYLDLNGQGYVQIWPDKKALRKKSVKRAK